MDNEQERNEHFKGGFAELLLEDLKECGAIPKFLNAYYAEQARTLIAQRAYDLASHIINALWPYINDNAIDPSASDIPDLTEWPKTASE